MSQLARKLAEKAGLFLGAPEVPATLPSPFKKQRFALEDKKEAQESKKENMITKYNYKTPTPKKFSTSPSLSPVGNIDQLLLGLSITNPACCLQTVKGFFSYTHISGRWEEFNFKQDVMEGFALLRILLHNGIKEEDFDIS